MEMKKGITLIVLTVTIVISIILVSSIVISGNNIVNDTRKSEFAKEIYTLKTMLEEYKFRKGNYAIGEEININLNTVDARFSNQFSKEPDFSTNTITLNEIDFEELGVDNITRGTKNEYNDRYLISVYTGEVYYLLGEKIDDVIYYTLTDDLKSYIGK